MSQDDNYSNKSNIVIYIFAAFWVIGFFVGIHLCVSIFRRIKRRITNSHEDIDFFVNLKYTTCIYLLFFILSLFYYNVPTKYLIQRDGKVYYENSGWFFIFDKEEEYKNSKRFFLFLTPSDVIKNVCSSNYLGDKFIEFIIYSPMVPWNIYKTFLASIGVIELHDRLPVIESS